MPLSGKSAIIHHLEQNYSVKVIDFVKYIEELKVKLAQPDEEPENVEITFEILLSNFKETIKNLPKRTKFTFDNLMNTIVTEYEQVKQLLDVVDNPRYFYNLIPNEEALKDRFKLKIESEEENLNEDQLEEFYKTLEIPTKISNYLKERSQPNIIHDIDTSFSESKTKMLFDSQFGRNIILLKHDYNLDLENSLTKLAASYKALYVNVPYLIYRQFYEKNEISVKLQETYCKKKLNIEINSNNFNEQIYYKYNPIHFNEKIVQEIIINYINQNLKEIEENDNFVIISGYFNNDLLNNEELPLNLPLIEIKRVLPLGFINSFIQISQNHPKSEENEELIELEQPKPKEPKRRKKSGEDNNEDGEEQLEEQPEEEKEEEEEVDPDAKPPFKPWEFKWTFYDGRPRNYLQILKKYTTYPLEQLSFNKEEIPKEIYKILSEVIEKKEGKLYSLKFN